MTASAAPSTLWDLAVYSEDYNLRPEITEIDPATAKDWQVERAQTKREVWNELLRFYRGKYVPVRYADGTYGGFTVPAVAS